MFENPNPPQIYLIGGEPAEFTFRGHVQAVNAYGFSPAAKWSKTFTATDLAGVAKTSAKNVQLLALSDFHGALEGSSTNAGTALLTSAFANERKAVASTITLSSGDNIG
ncbi:MAG: bifunctional metallophosphatase/5'-nucleotidase, partial [Actinobacteria bacterium]|nr:bifunctional metallophosphatase/5'-nucleotidase [Actinomycetota bacterium]